MTTAIDEVLEEQLALVQRFALQKPSIRSDSGSTHPSSVAFSIAQRATQRVKVQTPEAAHFVMPAAPSGNLAPNFFVRQAWEGTVVEVAGDSFSAVLRDLTDPSRPDERVEMLRDDVSSSDVPLLVPGAVFYWNIGYTEGRGIPRRRTSQVTFRRLPRFIAAFRPRLTPEAIREALTS